MFTSGEALVATSGEAAPDAAIVDVRLLGMSGLEAARRLRAVRARLPVLLVSGYPLEGAAADAVASGEFAFLAKPLRIPLLADWIAAAARAKAPSADEAQDTDPYPEIVGASGAMREVRAAIARCAPTAAPVLLLGETGTGKEIVARAIHRTSPRRAGPLVPVNCAAVPETTVENEFFGHERGAFTDAGERHIGSLERAHHGTIFLDEIGDMSIAAQVKLLRAIEQQEIVRLGWTTTVAVDIRVVAATSHDLEAEAAAGRFRRDLYYRLAVAVIRLPPLRERREDLGLLARRWLATKADGGAIRRLSLAPEALAVLSAHDWPGNVRELQNVLFRAALHASGTVIGVGDLPPLERRGSTNAIDVSEFKRPPGMPLLDALRAFVDPLERQWILEALEAAHGSRTTAARDLGIDRKTLFERAQRLGIASDQRSNRSSPKLGPFDR